MAPAPQKIGLVACGALAREFLALTGQAALSHIEVKFLPAALHNTPGEIPGAVESAIADMAARCDRVVVGYADCGTAGGLDAVLARYGATRLPGAHCYAFYAGVEDFADLHEAEPGTFYLTDYLARQFETLVYGPLGLNAHPELLADYFGNYTRLMYLAQTEDDRLTEKAEIAAQKLGLRFERRFVGTAAVEKVLERWAR
jgi:uncharacterized protein DUF1638